MNIEERNYIFIVMITTKDPNKFFKCYNYLTNRDGLNEEPKYVYNIFYDKEFNEVDTRVKVKVADDKKSYYARYREKNKEKLKKYQREYQKARRSGRNGNL